MGRFETQGAPLELGETTQSLDVFDDGRQSGRHEHLSETEDNEPQAYSSRQARDKASSQVHTSWRKRETPGGCVLG